MVVRGFRLQWLAPFLGLAAIFGGCRSSTPVVAGADPSPPSPTSTDPSVWSVDLMTVLPGEHDRYRRFIDANWARARRTARERGQVLSYHALFRPDTAQGNWHVVLPTEYPDSAAYGRREEIFSRDSGIGFGGGGFPGGRPLHFRLVARRGVSAELSSGPVPPHPRSRRSDRAAKGRWVRGVLAVLRGPLRVRCCRVLRVLPDGAVKRQRRV